MTASVLTGILAAGFLFFTESRNGKLLPDGRLERNEWGNGDYVYRLKAAFPGEKIPDETVEFIVKERVYTEKECEELAKKASEELESMILNGNKDLMHVTGDLLLPYSLPDLPFHFRWDVSDDKIMDRTGRLLCGELRNESFSVTVSCVMTYMESRYTWERMVTIVPENLSREEELSLKLNGEVTKVFSDTGSEKTVSLPGSVDGIRISWSEVRNFNGLIPLLAGIGGALLIGAAVDHDERRKKEKEAEALSELYASFTEKLKLYLMSGLTMRNAFFAIAKDYEKAEDRKYELLYQHLRTAINRFRNNVREETVYAEWGDACMGPYKRLSFLLSVNLKQGSGRLLQMLDEEAKAALSERRERAKKKGAEAGVKLLFPMILMLIVVMMLIMLPAYLSLG